MSIIQELFNELFFGVVGGWLGFILVSALMILVTAKERLAGILFIPTSIMIGILMLSNVATNQNLMWASILYFLLPIFLVFLMIKGKK